MHQDDASTISSEKNEKLNIGKRTKHINNEHSFAVNRQLKRELKMQHCPTNGMIADFHAKPLQGHKFHKFTAETMNFDNDNEDEHESFKQQRF